MVGRQRRTARTAEGQAPLGVRRGTGAAPSDVARDRLAERLRHDVADVRVRLEEAVLRTDALLASGQPDRAAEVLDEQQALLDELHDTLASSVAAAAVEAAAEAVLTDSPDSDRFFEPAPQPTQERPARRHLRTTASALVSAAAAIALAVMVASPPGPRTFAAAGFDEDVTNGPTVSDGTVGSDERAAAAGGSERAIGPNELELRRLLTSPSPSPAGERSPAARIGASLSGLQELVDGLLATVVRAAGDLTPDAASDLATELEAVLPERSSADSDERRAEHPFAPREEPSASETASEEPSETATEEPDDEPTEAGPSEPSESEPEPAPTFPIPQSLDDTGLSSRD